MASFEELNKNALVPFCEDCRAALVVHQKRTTNLWITLGVDIRFVTVESGFSVTLLCWVQQVHETRVIWKGHSVRCAWGVCARSAQGAWPSVDECSSSSRRAVVRRPAGGVMWCVLSPQNCSTVSWRDASEVQLSGNGFPRSQDESSLIAAVSSTFHWTHDQDEIRHCQCRSDAVQVNAAPQTEEIKLCADLRAFHNSEGQPQQQAISLRLPQVHSAFLS